MLARIATAVITLWLIASNASAQTALTGHVTSAEEGAMEGVLVSAKKAGSTITITVVSDAQGRYSFPAGKLEPGQYALSIRAVGYDLDNAKRGRGAAQKTTTRSQAAQDRGPRRAAVERRVDRTASRAPTSRRACCSNCVGCHTLERVMRSPHDADTFMKAVLPRMQGYVNQSIPAAPAAAPRRAPDGGARRPARAGLSRAAEYLSTINLGANAAVEFDLEDVPAAEGPSHARHLHRI